MGFVRFFINQHKVINLVVLFILITGGLYFWKGQKEGFPNITLDTIVISTPYLGASSIEIETLVTKKIEEAVEGINGKKRVASTSIEGLSTVVFEIDPDLGISMDDIVTDIKSEIDRIKKDLPSELKEEPFIKEIKATEFPILSVMVSGDISEETLREVVDKFEDRLIQISGVSKVEKEGYRDREIWIEVKPKKLRFYDLEIGDVINTIKARSINLPGGKIRLSGKEYLIRTMGQYETLQEIRQSVVRANDSGQIVKIKDVASVKLTFEDTERNTFIQGASGINLNILKKSTGDIIETVNDVKALIKEYEDKNLLPEGARIFVSNDLSFFVKRRLKVLTQNATLGLVFVFICLIFFFDFKTTFWTTLGIPVAFCAAMIVVSAFGLTLNLISMFGFIVVVGMIVDDAIVVSENIYRHREMGKDFIQSAIDGTVEVLVPLTGMIMTTVLAFAPLLGISGIMGKFLGFIPKVVIATMVASYFECILILPGHLAHVKISGNKNEANKKSQSKKTKKNINDKRAWFKVFQKWYVNFIVFALKKPFLSVIVIIISSTFLLVALLRVVPFVLFPGSIEELVVKLDTPKDNSLKKTQEVIGEVESNLRKNMGTITRELISTVGYYVLDTGIENRGTYLGSITVVLKPENKMKEKQIVELIEKEVVKVGGITKYKVDQVRGGPPVPKPVFVQFFSDNLGAAEKAAIEIRDFLKDTPNTISVDISSEEGKKEFRLRVNEEIASILGININSTAIAVKNAFDGGIAAIARSMRGINEDIDIVVKYPSDVSQKREDLNEVMVKNIYGKNILLNKFALIERGSSFSAVNREDQSRYISVSSQLINVKSKKHNAAKINALIASKVAGLESKYPNVEIKIGGDQEETQKQVSSTLRALAIALMGVLIVLTALFKSFIQPFIVMSVIPFAFVGLMMGLFFTNTPLGLFPMIGMVALVGVVVNDSMILVSFVNKLRREGHSTHDALVESCKNRLRPILLTTLTTAVGLLPLAYSILGSEPFLEPMAIGILWGLVFCTFFVLTFIPCLYYVVDSCVQFLYRMLRLNYKLPGSMEK